jgi:hypothetical protein
MDSADFDQLARSLVTRDAGGSPTDADRFDAFTRSQTAVAPSRRRLLTGVAGASLAALATALGFAPVGATSVACLNGGKHCTEGGECCSDACKRKRCRAHNVGRCTAARNICATGLESKCNGGSCSCFGTTGGLTSAGRLNGYAWPAARMPSVPSRSIRRGLPASYLPTTAAAPTAPPPFA